MVFTAPAATLVAAEAKAGGTVGASVTMIASPSANISVKVFSSASSVRVPITTTFVTAARSSCMLIGAIPVPTVTATEVPSISASTGYGAKLQLPSRPLVRLPLCNAFAHPRCSAMSPRRGRPRRGRRLRDLTVTPSRPILHGRMVVRAPAAADSSIGHDRGIDPSRPCLNMSISLFVGHTGDTRL